jgi:hypothetical protein
VRRCRLTRRESKRGKNFIRLTEPVNVPPDQTHRPLSLSLSLSPTLSISLSLSLSLSLSSRQKTTGWKEDVKGRRRFFVVGPLVIPD